MTDFSPSRCSTSFRKPLAGSKSSTTSLVGLSKGGKNTALGAKGSKFGFKKSGFE
jgi:hypothetical protein